MSAVCLLLPVVVFPPPGFFSMFLLVTPSGISDPVGVSLAGRGQLLLSGWGLAPGHAAVRRRDQCCTLHPGRGTRHPPRAAGVSLREQGCCVLPRGESGAFLPENIKICFQCLQELLAFCGLMQPKPLEVVCSTQKLHQRLVCSVLMVTVCVCSASAGV